MRKCMTTLAVEAVALACVSGALADSFGTGGNQFTIDFVPISGDTDPSGSLFGSVNNDYRMGTFEITNDQWGKFEASLGVPVTGNPLSAYDQGPWWQGTNVPTTGVSWYEAAQFVNWLNTSAGHQAAYKFTGTQGMGDYTLDIWSAAEADNGTNLYRHKDAIYYMPTEDEWVKAAYWNGATLQSFATKPGDTLHQGDGVSGTGWNYYDNGYVTDPPGPWAVGSGSEELNGTFDMMGNVYEWMESPFDRLPYTPNAYRAARGGSYTEGAGALAIPSRDYWPHEFEFHGFRVASEVPEPSTLVLLSLGGLTLLKRRRRG